MFKRTLVALILSGWLITPATAQGYGSSPGSGSAYGSAIGGAVGNAYGGANGAVVGGAVGGVVGGMLGGNYPPGYSGYSGGYYPGNDDGYYDYYSNGVWDNNDIYLPDTATSSVDFDIVDCDYCRHSGGQRTTNQKFENRSRNQANNNWNRPQNVPPPPGLVSGGSGPYPGGK